MIKNEIETIQFASTCKNVVLSHGTYSGIIGYLSFYSNVYYCKVNTVGWQPVGPWKDKDKLPNCKPGKWIGIELPETTEKFANARGAICKEDLYPGEWRRADG